MRKWRCTVALACAIFACSGDRPSPSVQRKSGETSATVDCVPDSAWRRRSSPPPPAAGIGVLVHALTVEPVGTFRYKVRWIGGEASEELPDSLLASPEGDLVPMLAPSKLPAVFDIDETEALVWGKRGWGCVSRNVGSKDAFKALNALLERAVESIEHEVREQTNSDKYTLHNALAITVSAQGLRNEPNQDGGADTGRSTRSTYESCLRLLEPIPPTLNAPPLAAVLKSSRSVLRSCVPAVRILRRAGDWAQVVLPDARHPVFDMGGGRLAIRWANEPSGWIRLSTPGPVSGSRLIQWHIVRWVSIP